MSRGNPVTTGAPVEEQPSLPFVSEGTVTTGQVTPRHKASASNPLSNPESTLERRLSDKQSSSEKSLNRDEIHALDADATSHSVPDNSGSQSQGQGYRNSSASALRGASGSTSQGFADDSRGQGKKRGATTPLDELTERRKQKRLAKNRLTAAASRQRKREQMTSLQQQVEALEKNNLYLMDTLAARDEELNQAKQLLASFNRGASGEDTAARASESAVLEGKEADHKVPSSASPFLTAASNTYCPAAGTRVASESFPSSRLESGHTLEQTAYPEDLLPGSSTPMPLHLGYPAPPFPMRSASVPAPARSHPVLPYSIPPRYPLQESWSQLPSSSIPHQDYVRYGGQESEHGKNRNFEGALLPPQLAGYSGVANQISPLQTDTLSPLDQCPAQTHHFDVDGASAHYVDEDFLNPWPS